MKLFLPLFISSCVFFVFCFLGGFAIHDAGDLGFDVLEFVFEGDDGVLLAFGGGWALGVAAVAGVVDDTFGGGTDFEQRFLELVEVEGVVGFLADLGKGGWFRDGHDGER